jgi:hypothetical protein
MRGCAAGRLYREKSAGDHFLDGWRHRSCVVDDKTGNTNLRLECIEECSDRSLPIAAGRPACRDRPRGSSSARSACDLSRSEWLSAGRRSHAQARDRPSRANGLPPRPQNLRRRDRDGQRQSARSSWETATGLAGMPRRWRGRTLPHELAIGRFSRWPLFRAPAPVFGHWQSSAGVDRG